MTPPRPARITWKTFPKLARRIRVRNFGNPRIRVRNSSKKYRHDTHQHRRHISLPCRLFLVTTSHHRIHDIKTSERWVVSAPEKQPSLHTRRATQNATCEPQVVQPRHTFWLETLRTSPKYRRSTPTPASWISASPSVSLHTNASPTQRCTTGFGANSNRLLIRSG